MPVNTNLNETTTSSYRLRAKEEQIKFMKLDVKFRRYINTAFIIGPMTMIMAFVGVLRNYGMHEGWIVKVLLTWLTMFPVAYVCAFFIIPLGNKLTGKIPFRDSEKEL